MKALNIRYSIKILDVRLNLNLHQHCRVNIFYIIHLFEIFLKLTLNK